MRFVSSHTRRTGKPNHLPRLQRRSTVEAIQPNLTQEDKRKSEEQIYTIILTGLTFTADYLHIAIVKAFFPFRYIPASLAANRIYNFTHIQSF